MRRRRESARLSRDERGFTLAGLLVATTVLALVIAYTVPPWWSDILKRERDMQTIWVMKQYARGIQEYQRKRGALPTSIEQLGEQKNPRVMRRLYPNPLSGKMDWIQIPPGAEGPGGMNPNPSPSPQNPVFRGQGSQPPVQTPARPQKPGQAGQPGQQVGPFVGVRPPNIGKAYVSLKGSDRYEDWSYTIADLSADAMSSPQGQVPQQSVPRVPPRPKP